MRPVPGAPGLRSSIGTRAPGFYPGGCRFESGRRRPPCPPEGNWHTCGLRNRRVYPVGRQISGRSHQFDTRPGGPCESPRRLKPAGDQVRIQGSAPIATLRRKSEPEHRGFYPGRCRFESLRSTPPRPAEGNWHTWICLRNEALLGSTPRAAHQFIPDLTGVRVRASTRSFESIGGLKGVGIPALFQKQVFPGSNPEVATTSPHRTIHVAEALIY